MAVSQSWNTVIALLANDAYSARKYTRFEVVDNCLLVRLGILGSTVSVAVTDDGFGRLTVGGHGSNVAARRWLHDVLVVGSRLQILNSGRELQVVQEHVKLEDVVTAVKDCAKLLYSLRRQEERADFDPDSVVSMYWSSGVLNFGDWSGPHIVHSLTGRQPVQANRAGAGGRVLYSVGSILGWIKRNNVDIWGSGLIKPLTKEEIAERSKLRGIQIHAVRGRRTKEHLERSLDWEVPEVFGDPALLLPDFVSAARTDLNRFVVVPHHIHKGLLSTNISIFSMADVRGDLYDVCRTISSSSAVISSSLHGLVVAQAFGVPWVWLRIVDKPLIGDEFKFEDFFSCMSRDAVSIQEVRSDELSTIDFAAFASRATLPELNIDLNLLREAMPVPAAAKPVAFTTHKRCGR